MRSQTTTLVLVALAMLAKVTDDGFRIATGTFAAPHLLHAFAIQLAFGEYDPLRIIKRKAVIERRDGNRERHIGRGKAVP